MARERMQRESKLVESEIAIEASDVTVAYGDRPVLWDVDLQVPEGVLMAVVGPNGAGKTTLIKAVLGLVPKAAGRVLVHGAPYEAQRKRVAYVPQRGSVDWDFPTSVLDVVTMGTYGRLGWLRRPGAAERARAMEALSPAARAPSSRGGSSSASSSPAPSSRTPTSTSWTSRSRASTPPPRRRS